MLPLAGRRVLVTRTRSQASVLANHIHSLGGEAILIPAIELTEPTSFQSLDDALGRLDSFHWLIFTSANAVEAFGRRCGDLGIPIPAEKDTAAIGSVTATAARRIGLHVVVSPHAAVAEKLSAALIPLLQPGESVLMVRAAEGRDHLLRALTTAGSRVTIAEAYRTIVPASSASAMQVLFRDESCHPDAVTFTSSSTARNLLCLLDAAGMKLPAGIVRASIGPVTSETLRRLDLAPHLEAPEATVGSLADALGRYFSREVKEGGAC